jgi:hypothetical protein
MDPDPDPGGPKTNGSGSATMENRLGSPEDLPNYKQTILYDYRLKTTD